MKEGNIVWLIHPWIYLVSVDYLIIIISILFCGQLQLENNWKRRFSLREGCSLSNQSRLAFQTGGGCQEVKTKQIKVGTISYFRQQQKENKQTEKNTG